MFSSDKQEIHSREIRLKFLKDGELPADELIDSMSDAKCSRCGRPIKKGDKIAVVSYRYLAPPHNPFIVYIVAPAPQWKTGYKILCAECSGDTPLEAAKKNVERTIDSVKKFLS
jgi:hypothetical protein